MGNAAALCLRLSAAEWVIATHPDVADAAVIGVPDAKWGETPLALVVLRANAELGAAELRERLSGQPASYQRVAAVEFRESLPRIQLGKLLKRELREPHWRSREAN